MVPDGLGTESVSDFASAFKETHYEDKVQGSSHYEDKAQGDDEVVNYKGKGEGHEHYEDDELYQGDKDMGKAKGSWHYKDDELYHGDKAKGSDDQAQEGCFTTSASASASVCQAYR